jgi:hypothetical protein
MSHGSFVGSSQKPVPPPMTIENDCGPNPWLQSVPVPGKSARAIVTWPTFGLTSRSKNPVTKSWRCVDR